MGVVATVALGFGDDLGHAEVQAKAVSGLVFNGGIALGQLGVEPC